MLSAADAALDWQSVVTWFVLGVKQMLSTWSVSSAEKDLLI